MTRNDLILIGMLMIFSLIPLAINPSSAKKFAVIKVDGVIIRKLNLSVDETFTVETSGGKNIVAIKNGAVSVVKADCPDKICMRRGAIKNSGEMIACVPHKVLIEIVGD